MVEPVMLRWIWQRWPAPLAVVACILLVVGLSLRRAPEPTLEAPPVLSGAIAVRVIAQPEDCQLARSGACDPLPSSPRSSADAGVAGDAIAGARVRVFQIQGQHYVPWAERVSDAGGRARVPAASGAYWLLIDAPGRARRSLRLVLDGALAPAIVALPRAEPLSVSVTDEAGKPIAGATVLVLGDDELPHAALTSEAGVAHLDHVGARLESVRVNARDHDAALVHPTTRDVRVSLGGLAALEVEVRDVAGRPAHGAEVWISGVDLWPARQASAGADGVARLEGLARGTYDLRARLGSQVSAAQISATVERGQRAHVNLQLAEGRFVAVRVRSGADAAPVPNADVTLVEDGLSPFPLAARTLADGTSSLGPVPAGSAVINVRADGFMPESVPLPRGAEAPLEITLVRGGHVTGQIVDGEGRAIEGARLEVVGNDLRGRPIARHSGTLEAPRGFFERSLEAPLPLVPMGELGVLAGPLPVPGMPPVGPAPTSAWVSDLDGNYRIDDLPPGKLRVLARHPDFVEGLSDTLTLEPGGSAHVRVVLERGASLGGRVLDPLGRPVARARVDALSPRATQSSALTGSDGYFAFRALPVRVDLLVARPDERQRFVLRRSLELGPGEAREIEITLPRERPALTVLTRGEDGQPLAGASVTLLSVDPSLPLRQRAESDARGECSMSDAVGIAATLRVQAPGFRIFETELEAVPTRVEVALSRGVSVAGRVTRDRGREGVRGAELVLLQDGERRSALSDANGDYEITGAALGPATLSLRHPKFSPASWDVEITPGDREGRAAPLEALDLDEPGSASGTVLDARGEPVRGARVGVGLVPAFVPVGARLPGFVESDERGHFELRGLEPGRVTLSAYAAGVGRGSLDDVSIASSEESAGLEIRLTLTHAESEIPALANVAVTLGERTVGSELEVVIVNVAAGSEAERAGVRRGDVLWSIDEQTVADMTSARGMLGGSTGSDVVLELERQGETAFVRVRREAVR